jgi:elongation factor 2
LKEISVEKVYVSMGSFNDEVDEVSAGNIAVMKISDTLTAGETLVDVQYKTQMVPFETIRYISEPVLTVAIEPKNAKDIFTLLKTLNKLVTEDPNLAFTVDKETGEYLLSVMGELHLDVAASQLKKISGGIPITVSSPRVVYRETVTRKGVKALARSPNKQNSFVVQAEPEEEQKTSHIRFEESGNVLSLDEQRNVLVDTEGKTEQLDSESLSSLIAGFEFACKSGPLCREPMRHVKVSLTDLQLDNDVSLHSSVEIMHGMGKAIYGSFLTAKPVLLEPVYKTVISVPTELAGECSRILGMRRAKINAFEQRGFLTVITGYMPVSETLGLSEEIRSVTSGRAIWQNVLDHWEKIPHKLAAKVIAEIRKRKGLSEEVPAPGKFLEEKQT